MSIGERIKKARELRGMSPADLANKIEFSPEGVVAIEEKGLHIYAADTVVRICDALNVSTDWLLGRIPDDRILLPRELNAENGAKATLIGEFFEDREVECPECDGDGFCIPFGIPREKVECEMCKGAGHLIEKIPVSWTTIKDIWKAAVEHFESQSLPEVLVPSCQTEGSVATCTSEVFITPCPPGELWKPNSQEEVGERAQAAGEGFKKLFGLDKTNASAPELKS